MTSQTAPKMSAREAQMAEHMSAYRAEIMLTQVAMGCVTGDCECVTPHYRSDTDQALAEAGVHATLAAAAASMFQGLAALEAIARAAG